MRTKFANSILCGIAGIALGAGLLLIIQSFGGEPETHRSEAEVDKKTSAADIPLERIKGDIKQRPFNLLSDEELRALFSEKGATPVDEEITGIVRSSDGRPMEGVTILAAPILEPIGSRRGFNIKSTGKPPTLDGFYFDKFRPEQQAGLHAAKRILTDAQGEFRLKGLLSAKYGVFPFHLGYRNSSRRETLTSPGSRIEFFLEPIRLLKVKLQLPDGSAPEQANVQINHYSTRPNTQTRNFSWRPSEDLIPVDSTFFGIYAETVDRRFNAKLVNHEWQERRLSDPMIIELKERSLLRVYVKGNPPDTSTVWVADAMDEKIDIVSGDIRYYETLEYDQNEGAFVGVDLPFERAQVVLGNGGFELARGDTVLKKSGIVKLELIASMPVRADHVIVAFEGFGKERRDRPHFNFAVGVEMKNGQTQKEYVEDRRTYRDGQGRVWIPHYPVKVHSKGQKRFLEWATDNRGSEKAYYELGSTPFVTIKSKPKNALKIRITNYDSSIWEYRGAALGIKGNEGWRRSKRTLESLDRSIDANGIVLLADVDKGDYSLFVGIRGGRGFNDISVALQNVNIGDGVNETTITLPKLWSLSVSGLTASTQEAWSTLTLYHKDRRVGDTSVDAEGSVKFGKLPEGTYELRFKTRGGSFDTTKVMTVELEQDQTVKFKADD